MLMYVITKEIHLEIAIKYDDIEMVDFLVGNGVNIYFRNNNRETLLHETFFESSYLLKKYFIEYGLDINVTNVNQ
ncbi:hypothetical protein LY90DRAFT_197167 [Neocallimastix californiae]|uniref:Uncharacterized protein n=1 Tax=Neocallimastix californiae TaxID=1754190 RepID=A0A1Y2FR54_9FUNG|nr:hypothetical protein LY90DRAFT_197167 [Neocallimastix californiae]|eukprot:ORY85195.1 hypothetical protein LY90DRAFT_197167 [Neocallimastix californiae]